MARVSYPKWEKGGVIYTPDKIADEMVGMFNDLNGVITDPAAR